MSDAENVLQDMLIQFIKIQPQFETAEHDGYINLSEKIQWSDVDRRLESTKSLYDIYIHQI